MSVTAKLAAARDLVAAYRKWPEDSHKIYASFRDARIGFYDHSQASALPSVSVDVLKARARAVNTIGTNVNTNKFAVSSKLLSPDGHSAYYDAIQREANRQARKVGFLAALRQTLFGWYKR